MATLLVTIFEGTNMNYLILTLALLLPPDRATCTYHAWHTANFANVMANVDAPNEVVLAYWQRSLMWDHLAYVRYPEASWRARLNNFVTAVKLRIWRRQLFWW